MESSTRNDIVNLLEAAEELRLDELVEFLKDHLMQKKSVYNTKSESSF